MNNKEKNDNNERYLKTFVVVAVILLAIGYAIVTTSYIVAKKYQKNYTINVFDNYTNENKDKQNDKNNKDTKKNNQNEIDKNNQNETENDKDKDHDHDNDNDIDPTARPKFNVHYVENSSSPKIVGGTGTATISDDQLVALFDVSGMAKVGDKVSVKYDIYNESVGYDAILEINVTNSNPEYFNVYRKIDKLVIGEKETTTATITVELIKDIYEGSVSTAISGTIKAKPKE